MAEGPSSFAVLEQMRKDELDVRVAPLSFITRVDMHRPKRGPAITTLTLKLEGDYTANFMRGDFAGGLILADAVQYEATKQKLKAMQPGEGVVDAVR